MTDNEKLKVLQERLSRARDRIADYEWRISVHPPQFDSAHVVETCANRAARQFHTRRRNEEQRLLERLQAELAAMCAEEANVRIEAVKPDDISQVSLEDAATPALPDEKQVGHVL